jgi:hypothetical protein
MPRNLNEIGRSRIRLQVLLDNPVGWLVYEVSFLDCNVHIGNSLHSLAYKVTHLPQHTPAFQLSSAESQTEPVTVTIWGLFQRLGLPVRWGILLIATETVF